MKLLKHFEKTKECWFLIGLSLIFFLLRFPSLFEPYWYGDEGIYHVIGDAMNKGKLLYRDIWDNKPPLLYVIYAIFKSDQFYIRAFSLISGLLALFSFYALAKHLIAGKEKILFFITVVFGLFFATPFIEGNIANSENFMLFPILLSGLLIYKRQSLFIAGLLLSVSFLLKAVAVFDVAAFGLFLLFYLVDEKKDIKNITASITPVALGFLLPIILTSGFFLFHGAFTDALNATLRQNVGYVGYGNKFLIPQGFLILKLMFLFSFCGVLFFKRHLFGKQHVFVLLWFAFSLFNAFFSGRPYTHYVLTLLPSLCLLLGITIAEKQKTQKILLTALIVCTIFLLNRNFSFYTKTVSYYVNYLSFMTDKKSVSSYQTFFDTKTPRDYALAWYLNTHLKKDDNIFIWGNNGQLYTLINRLPPGRYIVAYHITASNESIKETEIAFKKNRPLFVVASENQSFPFAINGYIEKISMYGATIYERAY